MEKPRPDPRLAHHDKLHTSHWFQWIFSHFLTISQQIYAILLMICSFLMVTFPSFSDLESRIYHIYFKISTLHMWSCIPCFFCETNWIANITPTLVGSRSLLDLSVICIFRHTKNLVVGRGGQRDLTGDARWYSKPMVSSILKNCPMTWMIWGVARFFLISKGPNVR